MLARKIAGLRIVKFAGVGGFGALVNLAFLYLFTELFSIYYVFAALCSSQVSLTCNFILNDAFTWGKEKKKLGFLKRFGNFWLISHFTIGLDLAMLFILTEYFKIYYVLSLFLAILVSFLINFFLNKKFTFH